MQSGDLYNEVAENAEVIGATPHQLIQILMNNFLSCLDHARRAIEKDNYADKQIYLGRAGEIVRYLRQCLNGEVPEAVALSGQLESLYYFLEFKLNEANLLNQVRGIDEARMVMSNIASGWSGIMGEGK